MVVTYSQRALDNASSECLVDMLRVSYLDNRSKNSRQIVKIVEKLREQPFAERTKGYRSLCRQTENAQRDENKANQLKSLTDIYTEYVLGIAV